MKHKNAYFAMIAAVITIATVAPAVDALSTSVQVPDSQDVVIAWSWDAANGNSIGTHALFRYTDNDGNVNEATIFSVTGAACFGTAADAHVSCLIMSTAQFERNVWIWRNGTAEHNAGNYTLHIKLRNAVNTVIATYVVGIRITPDWSTNAQIAATETRLNQTVEKFDRASESRVSSNVTGEAQGTRALINQSFVNTTANITGDILNHTTLRASLAEPCHDGSYCLFNHVSSPVNDEVYRLAVFVALLAVLSWMAAQKSIVLPLVAILASSGIVAWALANLFFIKNEAAFVAITFAFLIPAVMGAFVFQEARLTRVRAVREGY